MGCLFFARDGVRVPILVVDSNHDGKRYPAQESRASTRGVGGSRTSSVPESEAHARDSMGSLSCSRMVQAQQQAKGFRIWFNDLLLW